jgi:GNAT superfamily N-acetyltransferase
MRRAEPGDIESLIGLMAEFYAEAGYTLDNTQAEGAFAALLNDERLGFVWVLEANATVIGHVVLTLRYAMEYAGLIACLDDLYVRPAWRNLGISTSALSEVKEFCATSGIRALTVEVGKDNGPAHAVYRRAGFTEAADRQLLTLPLFPPAHVV